jgi:hypothetical protein
MNAKRVTVVRIDCTPRDLREIADELEKAFAVARIGDDVPRVKRYSADGELEVDFVIDQEEMRRLAHVRNREKSWDAIRKKIVDEAERYEFTGHCHQMIKAAKNEMAMKQAFREIPYIGTRDHFCDLLHALLFPKGNS